MSESSGAHQPIRQEWVETPPDVSYRFVVSFATLRAADVIARAVLQRMKRKKRWWQRAIAFLMRDILRLFVGVLFIVLFGWLSLQAADATQRLGGGTLLPVATFLIVFLGLWAGFVNAARRLVTLSLQRFYREFYADNEFVLEGRKSHLWFDERCSGAIRRWSTFEQVVEFEEGMWLFLRRRTTFAGLRGILISKDSLPNSCAWSELQTYLSQRIDRDPERRAGAAAGAGEVRRGTTHAGK